MRCISRSITLLVSFWLVAGLRGLASEACVLVDGPRIHAGDLAPLAPAFAELPPDKDLGPAPAGTLVRLFHRGQLAALLPGTHSDLPERLCVQRRRDVIPPEAWQAAIERTVKESCGEIPAKIHVVEAPKHRFPSGQLIFHRAGITASRGSALLWRGSIAMPDKSSVPVWLRVELQTLRPAVLAARPIAMGSVLVAEDFKVENTWVPGICETEKEAWRPIGLSARRAISAGSEIRKEELRVPPTVRRGDAVEIETKAGAARIRIPAIAEQDAELGETAPFRSSWNGAKIAGRVVGNQKVRVE